MRTAAQIIWSQISIRTKMACGAREAKTSTERKVTFKVGGLPMRYVSVEHNGRDTYDVEYFRLKRGSYDRVELEGATDVYVDCLNETLCGMVNK